MNYKVFTDVPQEDVISKWNDFLEHASFASHYTTPNFFVDPFVRGGEKFAVLVFEGKEIVGVLTGVDGGRNIRSGLGVDPQVSFLQDFDRTEVTKYFINGIDEIGGRDLEFVAFHTYEEIPNFKNLGFEQQLMDGDKSVVMLDLSKGSEKLFMDFSQTRRNELRKAIKQNHLEIKDIETEQELCELYEIHKDWNARKGRMPDSESDWRFAVSQKDHRKVIIAKYEGKVIAGSYYRFCRGGIIGYAANNSLIEFQKFRPNDLIGWRSIEWACEQNFKYYSTGGSHLFLRRFGGDMFSCFRYRRDTSLFKAHRIKEDLRQLAINSYRNLPDSVREKIKKIAGR